jgi:hypothetical protein
VVVGAVTGLVGGAISGVALSVFAAVMTRAAIDTGRGVRAWHAEAMEQRGPFTDYGHGMSLFLVGCLVAAIALIVWIVSAPVDGYMTPLLAFIVGIVTAGLAAVVYLVGRGRI